MPPVGEFSRPWSQAAAGRPRCISRATGNSRLEIFAGCQFRKAALRSRVVHASAEISERESAGMVCNSIGSKGICKLPQCFTLEQVEKSRPLLRPGSRPSRLLPCQFGFRRVELRRFAEL